MDNELSPSQHRVPGAKRVNGILGCIRKSTASRSGRGCCHSAQPGEDHLECCVQFGARKYRREVELLEQVQERMAKMMKGLEHLTEERLRELGLFSLEMA